MMNRQDCIRLEIKTEMKKLKKNIHDVCYVVMLLLTIDFAHRLVSLNNLTKKQSYKTLYVLGSGTLLFFYNPFPVFPPISRLLLYVVLSTIFD